MKIFRATEKCSLRDFTDSHFPQGSFCLAALLRTKDVKVNGVRTGKNVTLNAGDEVVYYTTPSQEAKRSHLSVYEDENIFVADKLSGVTSEGLFAELCGMGTYFPVHRLDRNTQGLIIFAKNKGAEGELLNAFKEHCVQKTYLALCKNNFKAAEATLTAWLEKDAKASSVTICSSPRKGAVKIITEYKVEENRGDIAIVKVILHTGRTHQIRAHMAHIGCPVLGDAKYGNKALNKKYSAARQCLVAKYLKLKTGGSLSYLSGKAFESSFTPTPPVK